MEVPTRELIKAELSYSDMADIAGEAAVTPMSVNLWFRGKTKRSKKIEAAVVLVAKRSLSERKEKAILRKNEAEEEIRQIDAVLMILNNQQ